MSGDPQRSESSLRATPRALAQGPHKVAFVGGTRGIGRALARRLVARGDEVFLLGRDGDQLARSAADLAARRGAAVGHARLDLLDEGTHGPALDAADAALGGFDMLVVTAAEFATQEAMEADPERARRVLAADFTGTVMLCEAARRRLLDRGGGTLCVFGSVAGDRARKPSALYGAAKAGLAYYLDGVELRYGGRGLRVLLVKPGFVRTGMTQGLREPPFAADPDAVARPVAAALASGRRGVLYAPAIWRWVMLAIRWLPRSVLRGSDF